MATAPPPSQQQQQPFSTWTTNATQEILDSSIASKASKDIVADDNETPENRSGHTAANKHPTEDQRSVK